MEQKEKTLAESTNEINLHMATVNQYAKVIIEKARAIDSISRDFVLDTERLLTEGFKIQSIIEILTNIKEETFNLLRNVNQSELHAYKADKLSEGVFPKVVEERRSHTKKN